MAHSLSSPSRRRTPWYFITEIIFLVLPVFVFLIAQWKTINRTALLKSVLIIMGLGYAWSMLVSSCGWWVFNSATMLGVQVLPCLPLEEVLFYPLGGLLSVFFYQIFAIRAPQGPKAGRFWLYFILGLTLVAVSAVAVSLAQGHRPLYIISQIVLFNGLSIGLWFKIRDKMLWKPMLIAIICMLFIGLAWDWIAFHFGWWEFHDILGWMWPPEMPVDDWNFFIFAPLSAVSLYCGFDRR